MNAFVDSFAYWLADYYLATTVLLAVALAALGLIKQPVQRMAVVKATLSAIALSAGLCAVPGWSIVNLAMSWPFPQRPSVDAPVLDLGRSSIVQTEAPTFTVPTTAEAVSLPAAEAAPRQSVSWFSMALAGYCLGSAVTLLWLAAGMTFAHRLLRDATPASSGAQAVLAAVWISGPSRPELRVSDKIDVAAALGVWRPTILLPSSWATGRSMLELQTVIAHECAHVRNGDLRWLAFARLLCVVQWLQPLYWLIRGRMRLDQESLADLAAAELSSRVTYAEQLVAWARAVPARPRPTLASAVGFWESPSQLRRRVALLLDDHFHVLCECSRRLRWASLLACGLVAIGLSMVTFQPTLSDPTDDSTVPDRVVIGNRYVLCKVTTGLQRSLLGGVAEPRTDASACLLVNFAAFAEEELGPESPALKELSTLLAKWAKVDDRRLMARVILRPSSDREESTKSREVADTLAKHLETLGTAAGFRRVTWGVTHLGDLSFDWRKFIENAASLAKDAPADAEQGIGEERVKVFAVRTFLSHLLVDADCVVNIMPIVDEPEAKSFPREFERAMIQFVPLLEYDRKETMLLRVRSTLSVGERLEVWVDDRQAREVFAGSFGFKTCNLETSYVAESDAGSNERSEDKAETQHQSVGSGAVSMFVPGNPATPWDYGPNAVRLEVEDVDGKSLAGVEATLYRVVQATGEREQVGQVKATNESGVIEFLDVVRADVAAEFQQNLKQRQFPGSVQDIFYFVLKREGSATVILPASDFTLASRGLKRRVRMRPAAELTGRVTDKDGKPVAEATVVAGVLGGMFGLEGANAVRSDADGEFRFTNLAAFKREDAMQRAMERGRDSFAAKADPARGYPAIYDPADELTSSDLTVSHSDFAVTRVEGGDVPGETNVVMEPAAAIEGRVVEFGTGRPAIDVMVRTVGQVASRESQNILWQAGTALPAVGSQHGATTRTDAEGKYRLSNLPTGRYDVWAQAPNMDITQVEWLCRGVSGLVVDAAKAAVKGPELVIGPGATIRGQLVDAATAKPLSFADSAAVLQAVGMFVGGPNQQALPLQRVPLSADGKFELRVYPGKQRVHLMVQQGERDGQPNLIYQSTDDSMQSGQVFDLQHGEVANAEFKVMSAALVNEVRQKLQEGYEAQASGDPEAAIDRFGEVLKLDPENLAAVAARANCFERLGRDKDALAEFETAARLSSMDPIASWRIADLLATSNDPQVRDGDRAVEIATKVLEAVRRQPPSAENEVNALALLAAAQAEAGDFKAAVATQREAVQNAAERQLPEMRRRLEVYEAGKAWRRERTAD